MGTPTAPQRSYGCSFGCGNPYDYVLISVADASTLFLCLPCHLRMSADMVRAIESPEAEDVRKAMADFATVEQSQASGNGLKSRGHNAPAEIEDNELIERFDSIITADELPDAFK